MPRPIQADEITSTYHNVFELGQHQYVIYALLFGLVAVHNCILIMLAHTSRTKYQPFNKLYLFAACSVITMSLIAATPGQTVLNMRKDSVWLTVVVCLLQCTFVVLLIREISNTLGISVFQTKQTVQRRQQQAAKEQ